MTFDQAEALLRRVSYKPTWRLWLTEQWNHITLRIEHQEQDADRIRQEPILVCSTISIPADRLSYMSEAEFIHWLTQAILDQERHEMDEWFRVEGRRVREPHAKEKLTPERFRELVEEGQQLRRQFERDSAPMRVLSAEDYGRRSR